MSERSMKLKQRLRGGETTFGGWITVAIAGLPLIALALYFRAGAPEKPSAAKA